MNDPAYALLRHAMDDDVYLQYMDDLGAYRASRKAEAALFDRLDALLDEPAKQLLNDFLNEKFQADVTEADAAFTTGLAFGLQLLKLL